MCVFLYQISKMENLPQIDSKSQRQELFLLDIEGIDEYWGPTFRSIYEGDDHKKVLERLDTRIKNYDKEIERMCNYHYQGFIESIRELLKLKTQVGELNKELTNIDTELQQSAASALKTASELVKERKTEKNIANTIENLSRCLPVLKTYSKLQKQMNEKRYYQALKTLEQLEKLQLQLPANYKFSIQIRDSIPQLRESIKEASMSDLKDFLENIRKFSPKIGKAAMKYTAERSADSQLLNSSKKSNDDETGDSLTLDSEEALSAQDIIDYSPVYRCLHIHTVLNAKESFEAYYQKQRRQQARLVLQSSANMHEDIETYRSYLYAIAGFFVVENHVLNTAGTLVTKSYLDQVWGMAIKETYEVLSLNSSYCTDPDVMLGIKELLLLFTKTLHNYGYPVSKLLDLINHMRDHYNEVLMKRWVDVFRQILDEETFSPIQVMSYQDLVNVKSIFPFDDEALTFPHKLPFSYMVPKVYTQVTEFISASLNFLKDLDLSSETVNDMLRSSTTLLLTKTFSGSLSATFRKPGLGLLQVVQIITDIGYLENATVHLDALMSSVSGAGDSSTSSGRKQAMFHVAREDAERQISSKLREKMDEFLELENYDWTLGEPQGHASSFITDMIAFLHTVFASLTHCPQVVAATAAQTACVHIATRILNAMLSDDVKQLTMGALQQVNLDTIQCEQWAASEPVPGISDNELLQAFARLRQLLNLVTSADWNAYFHDFGQEGSKYPNLPPATVEKLLEKLMDNKNMFSVLKRSERDKKKLLDTVLKQLKQLALTTQQPD